MGLFDTVYFTIIKELLRDKAHYACNEYAIMHSQETINNIFNTGKPWPNGVQIKVVS